MKTFSITVNGERIDAAAEPRLHLGDFLREQQRLTGTHLGCEHGVCGACTVLIDGEPARSCIAYAVACDGREVRTIEGFGDDPVMAQLRTAFNREHALQCGFCTPGMLIAARDVVLRVPDADEARVRVEMSGNLCRCTGYRGIVRAVLSVLEARRAANSEKIDVQSASAPQAFQPFVAAAPTASSSPSVAVAPSGEAKKPGTVIEDEFTVAHPLERVWEIFADMPAVAACLPGAEVTESSADSLKGRVTTKFGPMQASFAGEAKLERDEAARRGAIRGSGTDRLSGSRARGDISYQLFDAGGGRTRVAVAIDYSLQGPLAQFSRGGLVREFVKKMVADFAANLDARLAGRAAPAAQVDAGGFFWRWLWSRIKAVFGGK
ncbi:MAG: 2Fe-2S iron-sulfur cluster-binding protein [Burkholderiales bacterium]